MGLDVRQAPELSIRCDKASPPVQWGRRSGSAPCHRTKPKKYLETHRQRPHGAAPICGAADLGICRKCAGKNSGPAAARAQFPSLGAAASPPLNQPTPTCSWHPLLHPNSPLNRTFRGIFTLQNVCGACEYFVTSGGPRLRTLMTAFRFEGNLSSLGMVLVARYAYSSAPNLAREC